MLQTKLCCTQLCENLMTFCPGPYKVTGPFEGTEKRLNRALTQPRNTAKMKPKINLLVLMCLQQMQSRQIWKSGCFQEADMVIVPLSSLWAGSCLYRLHGITTPPLLPHLHKWRSHDITLQPVGGCLHPLFTQMGFVSGCCAAVCGALQDCVWTENVKITASYVYLCLRVYFDKNVKSVLAWLGCYCAATCKVSCCVIWEGHMSWIPSWNIKEGQLTKYQFCYCNWLSSYSSTLIWV